MADRFVCSVCGKEHEGLPTDWAFTLPDEVWAIPEPERGEVAQFNTDLCKFDDRYFIRCVLEVPFTNREGFFGWGAWAEVDWNDFKRYLDLYESDGSHEPPKEGALANSLTAYPHETVGQQVLIQFREASQRPTLHLRPDDSSQLALEQRNGIDERRYHQILDEIAG